VDVHNDEDEWDALTPVDPPKGPAGEETRILRRGRAPRTFFFPPLAVLALFAGAVAVQSWFHQGLPAGASDAAEPATLGREPLRASFGLGPGMQFPHAEKKQFDFELTSPVNVVALLHYQAEGISEREVSITVNGAPIGYVPADTLDASTRTLDLVIPPAMLERRARNFLVFNNTHNPPRSDPWRIANPWIELLPVPEMTPAERLHQARETMRLGLKELQGKEIDKRNRYKAWKAFRGVWLTMEGYPDPKPELYVLARDRMESAQAELDALCARLLLVAERDVMTNRDVGAASAALDEVREWFPADDQPCPARAVQKRAQYGL
jgi:hypothetical protein